MISIKKQNQCWQGISREEHILRKVFGFAALADIGGLLQLVSAVQGTLYQAQEYMQEKRQQMSDPSCKVSFEA